MQCEQYLPARTLQEPTEKPSCREPTLSSRARTEPWKPGSEKSCTWDTRTHTHGQGDNKLESSSPSSSHAASRETVNTQRWLELFFFSLNTYLELGRALEIILKGNNSSVRRIYLHISLWFAMTSMINMHGGEKTVGLVLAQLGSWQSHVTENSTVFSP